MRKSHGRHDSPTFTLSQSRIVPEGLIIDFAFTIPDEALLRVVFPPSACPNFGDPSTSETELTNG